MITHAINHLDVFYLIFFGTKNTIHRTMLPMIHGGPVLHLIESRFYLWRQIINIDIAHHLKYFASTRSIKIPTKNDANFIMILLEGMEHSLHIPPLQIGGTPIRRPRKMCCTDAKYLPTMFELSNK